MHSQLTITRKQTFAAAGLMMGGLLLLQAPALAHHPFGGSTPTNAVQGFLSGLGHPVIGPDHLAFIIATGLLAALFSRGLMIPIAFVGASLLGTISHMAGANLPIPEFMIAASVLLFGILLAMKNALPAGIVVALAAIAGLFHGYAYGEAVIGAEMSPVVAYLLGFASIQMVISTSAYWLVKQLGASPHEGALNLRFAGFTLAGIGAAFVSGLILS